MDLRDEDRDELRRMDRDINARFGRIQEQLDLLRSDLLKVILAFGDALRSGT